MCGSCDNQWRSRESHKFHDGKYQHPIWVKDSDIWKDVQDAMLIDDTKYHFVHVSTNNPAMLAYTENATKGEADRQTPIKVGRYLNRFTKGLTEDRIRQVVEAHNSEFDTGALEIAKTTNDIVSVYLNGPSSCMSHSVSNFSSSEHPTSVYGAGDLGVAYVGGIAKPKGRALIHLEKKVFSTIYGDSARLGAILEKSGYKPDRGSDFEGAKINKITCANNPDFYVMPYMDNDYGVKYSECRKYFTMSRSPDYYAQFTHGLNDENGWWCAWCEDNQSDGTDPIYVDGTGDICECCYDDNFFCCDNCGEHSHNDEWRTVHHFVTRTITTDEVDPKTNTYIRRTERVRDERGVCSCCAEDSHFCESCEEYYNEATHSEHDDQYRCEDCHSEHEEEIKLEKEQDNNEE